MKPNNGIVGDDNDSIHIAKRMSKFNINNKHYNNACNDNSTNCAYVGNNTVTTHTIKHKFMVQSYFCCL